MKIIIIFLFSIMFGVSSDAQSDRLQDIRAQIEALEDQGIENYPPLTVEEREELSQYYCEILNDRNLSPPGRWPEILLALNRPCGIEMVLEKYYDSIAEEGSSLYHNQFALGSHAKESVLPYLYENVFYGEDGYGILRDANLLALHIIINSNQFPEKSRQWAKEIRDMMIRGGTVNYRDSILSQIKDWLYHNKDEILNENYENARWLPDGPPKERKPDRVPPPPPPPPESDEPPLIPRPVLTKLVKDGSLVDGERPSKAKPISTAEFFPARSRERKRPDQQLSKISTTESARVPWGTWPVGVLLVVLLVLSWNALRKHRHRAH
jgi:hypothetical protein